MTPGDILNAYPGIWPFAKNFKDYYKSFARPLPRPIDPADPLKSLKIDAMFVFNDPRDWGLDIQVIIDILLSSQGIMGTLSDKNGNPSYQTADISKTANLRYTSRIQIYGGQQAIIFQDLVKEDSAKLWKELGPP